MTQLPETLTTVPAAGAEDAPNLAAASAANAGDTLPLAETMADAPAPADPAPAAGADDALSLAETVAGAPAAAPTPLDLTPAAGAGDTLHLAETMAAAPAAAPVLSVTVRADGTGDYRDLVAAVAGAPAGTTIHLAAGLFRLAAPLLVTRPLRLVADEGTTIVCAAPECVVRYTGDGRFEVENVAWLHEGPAWANVAVVESGEAQIANCRFSGGDAGRKSGARRKRFVSLGQRDRAGLMQPMPRQRLARHLGGRSGPAYIGGQPLSGEQELWHRLL